MNKKSESVEKIKIIAWECFDAVESKQRELDLHSDPTKDDYLSDEDVVDVIADYLAQAKEQGKQELIKKHQGELMRVSDEAMSRGVKKGKQEVLNKSGKEITDLAMEMWAENGDWVDGENIGGVEYCYEAVRFILNQLSQKEK